MVGKFGPKHERETAFSLSPVFCPLLAQSAADFQDRAAARLGPTQHKNYTIDLTLQDWNWSDQLGGPQSSCQLPWEAIQLPQFVLQSYPQTLITKPNQCCNPVGPIVVQTVICVNVFEFFWRWFQSKLWLVLSDPSPSWFVSRALCCLEMYSTAV